MHFRAFFIVVSTGFTYLCNNKTAENGKRMIDKRTLENIMTDQKEELAAKRARRTIARKEEQAVDLDSPQAQVVIGVRRSGKSTLCLNVLHKSGVNFAYVNFDDERLAKITGDDLNDLLEVLYKVYGDFNHLFIDEIQNIPEWYLFVNRLLRRDMRIVITGSNAKLLSGELATHLTGRHHAIHLYPLSFDEYCAYRRTDRQSMSTRAVAQRRAAFDMYLHNGGFPELLSVNDARAYIETLTDNIIHRDIEPRFKISYKAAFEQMTYHLMNTAPTIVNDEDLRDMFGFKSIHTAKNYRAYLSEAYLFTGLRKYTAKSRLRVTGEKLYPIDVALMNRRADAFAGENLGWRLETIVYIELLRRRRETWDDIYYYRDRSGECDFIVCQGNKAHTAIQVSYDISSPKTRKRELAGLALAARKTGAAKLLLLTDHISEDTTVDDGIQVSIRPVYDFLLGL